MDLCYVFVPGNEAGSRIGIVKFKERGYYKTDIDSSRLTDDQVQETVNHLNEGLGVPEDVVRSARDGSMFGWHVPAAEPAVKWFEAHTK